MSWPEDVGILDIEVYFPAYYVEQTELEELDGCKGKYTQGLGQDRMAFCSDREDINSIMLTAVHRLLDKPEVDPNNIGYLEVGTETLVDKSKSTKTVLMELFSGCGNNDVAGVDCKNACFGGTAALFNAVNWIESSSWDGRLAIVVAGDIAIYSSKAARPTGGAGAVALLIGPNAPLILDRGVRSHYMTHCYDFYKPDMQSEYPMVDGPLSIKSYLDSIDHCYATYQKKALLKGIFKDKISVCDGPDFLCFHSPFTKLVQKSFGRLFYDDMKKVKNSDENSIFQPIEKFRDVPLASSFGNRELDTACVAASKPIFLTKVDPTLLLARNLGNCYTATLYCCLASLIYNCSADELLKKRVILFSYGSGLTACMYSLRVTSDTSRLQPLHSSLAGLGERLNSRRKMSPQDFISVLQVREESHNKSPRVPSGTIDDLFPGTYYLENVDEKLRRTYKRTSSHKN